MSGKSNNVLRERGRFARASDAFSFSMEPLCQTHIDKTRFLGHSSKHCLLVTEVYPEIEYHIINENLEEMQSAVNDSLSNGWKLQGGLGANGQAIWKYAE